MRDTVSGCSVRIKGRQRERTCGDANGTAFDGGCECGGVRVRDTVSGCSVRIKGGDVGWWCMKGHGMRGFKRCL